MRRPLRPAAVRPGLPGELHSEGSGASRNARDAVRQVPAAAGRGGEGRVDLLTHQRASAARAGLGRSGSMATKSSFFESAALAFFLPCRGVFLAAEAASATGRPPM